MNRIGFSTMTVASVICVLAMLLCAQPSTAQIKEMPVHFAKGKSSAAIISLVYSSSSA